MIDPLAAFRRLVEAVTSATRFHGLFPATVHAWRKDGGGVVDLKAEDTTIAGTGTDGVPVRLGLPGLVVEIPKGERVLMGFENGDPSKPFVTGFAKASTPLKLGTLLVVLSPTGTVVNIQFFDCSPTDTALLAAAVLAAPLIPAVPMPIEIKTAYARAG